MTLEALIEMMTPEIYQRLVSAVELGKWPNGTVLSPEQKEHSLQLVMLWQSRHNTAPQHMSINTRGEIEVKSKQDLK